MRYQRLLVLPFLTLFVVPALAGLKASDVVRFREASVRLLAERDAKGSLRGGIELRLEEGFKTYWKNPGDSGVPPQFDFGASTGIGPVEVKMPFPRTFDDGAGGQAFGYKRQVIFPFEGKAEAGGKVVLKLDFAVCGKLCIPLSATLSLPLDSAAEAGAEAASQLAATIAALPRKDESGPIEIKRVGDEAFTVRLPSAVPAQVLKAFPFAPGFFEIKGIEAAGEGQILIRLAGQRAPGGKTFGPLTLTYGTDTLSFERVLDVDGVQ